MACPHQRMPCSARWRIVPISCWRWARDEAWPGRVRRGQGGRPGLGPQETVSAQLFSRNGTSPGIPKPLHTCLWLALLVAGVRDPRHLTLVTPTARLSGIPLRLLLSGRSFSGRDSAIAQALATTRRHLRWCATSSSVQRSGYVPTTPFLLRSLFLYLTGVCWPTSTDSFPCAPSPSHFRPGGATSSGAGFCSHPPLPAVDWSAVLSACRQSSLFAPASSPASDCWRRRPRAPALLVLPAPGRPACSAGDEFI